MDPELVLLEGSFGLTDSGPWLVRFDSCSCLSPPDQVGAGCSVGEAGVLLPNLAACYRRGN